MFLKILREAFNTSSMKTIIKLDRSCYKTVHEGNAIFHGKINKPARTVCAAAVEIQKRQ